MLLLPFSRQFKLKRLLYWFEKSMVGSMFLFQSIAWSHLRRPQMPCRKFSKLSMLYRQHRSKVGFCFDLTILGRQPLPSIACLWWVRWPKRVRECNLLEYTTGEDENAIWDQLQLHWNHWHEFHLPPLLDFIIY